jgi:hypothetical protein
MNFLPLNEYEFHLVQQQGGNMQQQARNEQQQAGDVQKQSSSGASEGRNLC